RCSGDGITEPLSGQHTIAEWLHHPVGAQVLHDAIERLGVDSSALGSAPELTAMFQSIPLNKLRSFGLCITDDFIAELGASAHAVTSAAATQAASACHGFVLAPCAVTVITCAAHMATWTANTQLQGANPATWTADTLTWVANTARV